MKKEGIVIIDKTKPKNCWCWSLKGTPNEWGMCCEPPTDSEQTENRYSTGFKDQIEVKRTE
jgi:hypothetical protein